MKNLFKSFALAMLAAATFSSCEQDPCKDVVCGDQGQCVEGSCVCNAGYEQDAAGLCNTEQRAKFLGSYVVDDNCSSSGVTTYNTTIVTSTAGVTEVRLTNFWGEFTNAVVATVSGSTITIARQEPSGDGFFVEGSGTISGNTITWTYTITDERDAANIVTDNCVDATWTKS